MDLSAQISGGYSEISRSVIKLKEKLESIGVRIDHPIGDGTIFMGQKLQQYRTGVWTPYEIYLDYYRSITDTDFHIIYNKVQVKPGLMDEMLAREMIYAMSKHKPVVLLYPPIFQQDVPGFARNLISGNLSKIFIGDLTVFDKQDTLQMLKAVAIKPVQYAITNQDSVLIKRSVRNYFQALIADMSSDSSIDKF